MPNTSSTSPSVCLVVIDGWGVSGHSAADSDAILNAKTPVMNELTKQFANVNLQAHGLAVGLPEGLMGNSEVGHLNIGAGRVVYQASHIPSLSLSLLPFSFSFSFKWTYVISSFP